MSAKLIFLTGVLGVGGYVGHTVMNHDATVYPMSREQAVRTLVDGRTSVPRKDGDGTIEIWGAAPSVKGATLNMRYSATAPTLSCQAVVTEVSASETRVVPDCSKGPASDSAIANTTAALQVPMFEEHIRSKLSGQPFNRSYVESREAGIAMSNIGAMNREAMVEADKAQRQQAEWERERQLTQ